MKQRSGAILAIGQIAASLIRLISGVSVRWIQEPDPRPAVYVANHTSHLDFVVLWSALPRAVREHACPVGAADYWRGGIRGFMANEVFQAILVERNGAQDVRGPSDEGRSTQARAALRPLLETLDEGNSLVLFPEGTRGNGIDLSPFRSGLYWLCKARPAVRIVPAYIENMSRMLPKGEFLPIPLVCKLTFGREFGLVDGEGKDAFLGRARNVLGGLREQ
jgi:1-acyl-sn-glycerol-3-phosphate acyltransferase